MTELEQALISEIARLAEIEEDEVERDVPLADLGVDSLMALNLVAFIEKRLGVRIPDDDIRKVRTLADILALAGESEAAPIS